MADQGGLLAGLEKRDSSLRDHRIILLFCMSLVLIMGVGIAAQSTITMGDTSILPTDDFGNGNLLVSQQATLSQTATLQSMSFYVTQASGKLRMGVYDATGPSGGPGVKKAETNEITPIVGWNTANVITPVSLSAGTYWLAYLPSTDALHFRNTNNGSGKWYSFAYGTLPTTFSTTPTSGAFHFSFYSTLNTGPMPFDFTLTNSGNKTVAKGNNVTNTVTATLATGFTGTPSAVAYSVSGLPSGVTGSFSPTTCTPTCTTTLTIVVPASTPNSTSTITVTGTGGGQTRTTNFSLTINAGPDTQAPTVPTNLSALASSTTQANLTWTASTDNVAVTGYRLDVSTSSTFSSFVSGYNDKLLGTTPSTTITGLNPATNYYIRLRATDGTNTSGSSSTVGTATPAPSSSGGTYGRMGTNVDFINDFTTQVPFCDLMMNSRPWSQGTCPSNLLDAQGYPLSVPFPGGATCGDTASGAAPWGTMAWALSDSESPHVSHIPTGDYTLTWTGGPSTINVWGATPNKTFTNSGTGTVSFSLPVDASNGLGLWLTITSSPAGTNHVRDIHVYMPNCDPNGTKLNPVFINELSKYDTVRFMNFNATNGNKSVSWSDRRLPTYETQSNYGAINNGMAYETMVDIANAAGTNMWVNVPMRADDNYVHEMAKLLRDRLNSNHKLVVELSNEVWNFVFVDEINYAACYGQSISGGPACVVKCDNYLACASQCSGPDPGYTNCINACKSQFPSACPNDYGLAAKYYGARSAQVHKIFADEFAATGESSRLETVVAWQAAQPYWMNQGDNQKGVLANYENPANNPTGIKPTALAFAPYISGDYGNFPSSYSVQQILDALSADIAAKTSIVAQWKTLATQHGISKLYTYEGGQHLEGHANPALSDKFIQANKNAQMETIYKNYFAAMYASGIDLFVHFLNVGLYSVHGSWGLREHLEDTGYPKYDAMQTVLESSGGSAQTCAQQSGDVCGANEICNGTVLSQSGSGACCSSTCQPVGTTPPAFDFSLTNGGNKSVTQGSSVTNTVTSSLVSGTTQSVSYSVSGLPSGVSGSFSPTLCNPTCSTTLTLNAASSATTGTTTATVTGTGGGQTHTTTFSLTVNASGPPTCAAQGGDLCTASEICNGISLSHSGTGICCSITCTTPSLPVVTIVTADPNAGEGGDMGRFNVTRTGSTAAALVVSFTLSGNATNGTDYVTIPLTKTIPAGSTSAAITVSPIDDTALESSEDVILTLAANASYSIGSPASGTITISDNDAVNPPTNLVALAVLPNQIKLTWVDNATNETSYQVERSIDNAVFTPLNPSLASNTTAFTDSGLSAGTYYYRVIASNVFNQSPYSNVASATLSSGPGLEPVALPDALSVSFAQTPSSTIQTDASGTVNVFIQKKNPLASGYGDVKTLLTITLCRLDDPTADKALACSIADYSTLQTLLYIVNLPGSLDTFMGQKSYNYNSSYPPSFGSGIAQQMGTYITDAAGGTISYVISPSSLNLPPGHYELLAHLAPGKYDYDPFNDGVQNIIETDVSNNLATFAFDVTTPPVTNPDTTPPDTTTSGNNGSGGGGGGGGGSGGGGSAPTSGTSGSQSSPSSSETSTGNSSSETTTVPAQGGDLLAATCHDHIQNGGETGTDCGGFCGPCLIDFTSNETTVLGSIFSTVVIALLLLGGLALLLSLGV